MFNKGEEHKIKIPIEKIELEGKLFIPDLPKGIVIFVHGSGSSRNSPRNEYVAKGLNEKGFATLLFDLLTSEEERSHEYVFNIPFLSERLLETTDWVRSQEGIGTLPVGYFGASTGAAAALVAAAVDNDIFAVVSRGGRPDLGKDQLYKVESPTLLIVGSRDTDVIDMNKQVMSHLKISTLEIVKGASHLFEENGALDKVIDLANEWFNKTASNYKIKNKSDPDKLLFKTMKNKATPFLYQDDLEPLLDKISQSRIVMLGESSHGTEEFYYLRKIITQRLIDHHGYSFVAVEGDWPDCQRLNQYIHNGDKNLVKDVFSSFKRWPTWMWANREVANLVHWMRGREVSFYGLDVYSLYDSIDSIKSYMDKFDPELSQRLLDRYACLDTFKGDEKAYARSLLELPKGCEEEIVENLTEILALRLEDTSLNSYELFDVKQNAKIVRNAERYYRSMLYGGPESWNVRDSHMLDTLDDLLDKHGEGAKAIIWAHNTHIGDYRATDMFKNGYINLGGLARARYGEDNISLVGFGTNSGEVLAARAWGAEPEVMKIPPAPYRTYEGFFHKISKSLNSNQIFLLLDKEENLLDLKRGHRAIGVVYQPEEGAKSKHFVPTELSNRYDAFIYVDKTTALKTLTELYHTKESGLIPETWPTGV